MLKSNYGQVELCTANRRFILSSSAHGVSDQLSDVPWQSAAILSSATNPLYQYFCSVNQQAANFDSLTIRGQCRSRSDCKERAVWSWVYTVRWGDFPPKISLKQHHLDLNHVLKWLIKSLNLLKGSTDYLVLTIVDFLWKHCGKREIVWA